MNQEINILKHKYSINLVEWYHFYNKKTSLEKDTTILILGDCDENLINPIAKRVKQLDVMFESREYRENIKYAEIEKNVNFYNRYVDGSKVENYDENLKETVVKYDFLIIPTLTKKILESCEENKLSLFLEKIVNKWTDDGEVIFAFDNNLSIDLIMGEKIDENLAYFSYDDIKEAEKYLKSIYKNSNMKIFFPMPEKNFPIRIYSEKYLPTLDDEDQKVRNLIAINKFIEYTASYLIIFSKNSKINTDLIYIKYNIDRLKKYALSTSIEEVNKKRVVKKTATTNEANEHVKNLNDKVDLIDNKNIKMLKPFEKGFIENGGEKRAYVSYEYIEGELLSKYIIEKIKNGEDDVKVIKKYMDILIGKNSGLIDRYNIDALFSNAIIKNDEIYVIDGEWIREDTIEVSFLQYRILKYFYKAYNQYLKFTSFNNMLSVFLISREDVERYEEAENFFQKEVHGNINITDSLKYHENKMNVSSYYYIKNQYERMKDKVDRIVGGDNALDHLTFRQNETIRLTNIHVNNLESIIKNLKIENTELSKQVDFFHKREAVIYKILRKIKNAAKKILPEETIRRKIFKYIYRTFRHPLKMMKVFFTSKGRNRIKGDFFIGDAYFDCGKVDFPKNDSVVVSIVIPTFNNIRYTYKCLYSIMTTVDNNKTPYEVILADDNSTDTTKNIKKYVSNIIVSRNSENLGFLKNCNKAAKLARGKYIFFLNNDTELKENAIYSLYELIERDITIGMVGSKLIYPNGILQEAGGIIWSDGTGANYGRGQNPTDYKFNYIKEVDYISGAAIMIRKSLWDEIGGFDERFAPAYCEDSDLAFSVREFGMKVMYQPMSEVIHYEGISNGLDVNDKTSLKSYQVENVKKLKEKWDSVLINQYPAGNNPNFFKARERNFQKKTILFIDHYVPTWDKDAGSKTIFSYIRMFLMKGFIVKFLGDNFLLQSPYGEVLQQMGVEVLYGNELQTDIWDFLKQNRKNIEYVFLSRPHIAIKYIDFIKEYMESKIIFYGHDLHYMRLMREYDLNKDSSILNESKYYRNLEYALMYRADVSYYPSITEIEEIRSVDEKLTVKEINAYMYNEVSMEKRDFNNTKDILFVGGFSHKPNVDALKWFDESILPRINARNSMIKLTVVGSNATEEVKEICSKENYNFYGYVSDEQLNELYKSARIVIAPLRYGAGIKGKIVEAMSKGSAIITTSCGAEGIKNAEKFMKIKDHAQEFAYEIVKLYDNFEELEKLSFFARKEINKHFTMDAAWDIIKSDFGRG